MSIITFWNDTREQSGKTLTSVAVAIEMAMERNSRILLISTSFNDSTLKDCFFGNDNVKNMNFFNSKVPNISVENGIDGLIKLVSSKKLTPDIITDYTKVIFKERLEILQGVSFAKDTPLEESYEKSKRTEEYYIDLIKVANQYYDIVIVDLDKMLKAKIKEEILKISDLNIYVLSQKLGSINRYNELKHGSEGFIKNKCIPVIGKYNSKYKYNSKNIARYLGEKKELQVLPLNLLYMAAAEENNVVDLFLKLRNVKDKTDENYIFMDSVLNLANTIFKKLQDMQMRMR